MTDRTTLLVVIVNYRTAGLVVDCLASLAGEVGSCAGVRVVVTDNDSGDDSVETLRREIRERAWDSWAVVQPLHRNGGFAWGNNEAIRPALESSDPPRYVLLLNPDTVVRPNALAMLVAFLDDHPEVGIAGSRLEHRDGTPQVSAFRFHSILSELEGGLRFGPVSRLLSRWVVAPPPPDEPRPTDWVSGASMIVRREVFEAIGLLDDGYFMYYEETDFCLRARRAGWACWYVPTSRVVHLVGQSSGVHDRAQPRKRLPSYWFDSRRRYFLKNHGRAATVLANLGWALGYSAWRIRRVLQRRPDRDPDRMLGDFLRSNFRFSFSHANRDLINPAQAPDGRPLSTPESTARAGKAVPVATAPESSATERAAAAGLSALGIVVIGRNEGERLRVCLESSVGHGAVVVYVDSGSTDDSVALAYSLGVEVVELDPSLPFSAARARNAGFERLRQIAPDRSVVQFVDGDCELDPNWLECGLRALASQPDAAVVCGRLRERYPERSVYNRLADLEWDVTVGDVDACGGIAMLRNDAFEAVGGFDPTVTAGEEPELCARLRRAGWAIRRLDAEMARHDMNVMSFGPWWHRQIRGGYASLHVTRRLGGVGPFAHQVRSARIWTIGWLASLVAVCLPGALRTGAAVTTLGVAVVAIAPALQALKIAAKARKRTLDARTALDYGVFIMIGKWGEMLGQASYLRDRAAGRRAALIEYKTPARPARTALVGVGRDGGDGEGLEAS